MSVGVIVLIILVVLVLGVIAIYNGLVQAKVRVDEAWSDISVQLKRRYDLIPNLVNTVKGYATHEKDVLERVVEARNRAQSNQGAVGAQSEDERRLVDATRQLFAVIENYPDLKASTNFLHLQQELVNTEDRIAAARRFYNANVRDYTVSLTTFPTMLVRGMGDFPPADYFEVDDYTVRAAPNVSLTPTAGATPAAPSPR